MKKLIFTLFLLYSTGIFSQLKPGYEKTEYVELLKIYGQHYDTINKDEVLPDPDFSGVLYQSEEMGLHNKWDLWMYKENIPVISIRGTIPNQVSWLENYFAAMVKAKGSFKLSENEVFEYDMAENDRAEVHVGWLIGTAFLVKDMLPRIDSLIANGHKEFLIVGHSQGGAIAFLLNAYLYGLKRQKKIPEDVIFKTYCSAAPKPGNLYFAYDLEYQNREGWLFNTVNAADWVPETPFSLQTISDFNDVNPFRSFKEDLKDKPFTKRMVFKHVFNKLTKPSFKVQKEYKKYMGQVLSKYIEKDLTGLVPPEFTNSSYYSRTGTTIVLNPDEAYYRKFKDSGNDDFIHHHVTSYLYLTDQLK
jgi:hypothetical protein